MMIGTENKNFIRILSTGGGRFVVVRRLRSSAGTFIRYVEKNVVLDPGPGTLVVYTGSESM
jgi:hypothetical protein